MSTLEMDESEAHRRLEVARKEAENRLLEFVHGACDARDVVDAMEISNLWRMATEQVPLTPMTWAQILEATNG